MILDISARSFHFIKWNKDIFKQQCERCHKEFHRNVRTNANKYDHQQLDLKVSVPPPKRQKIYEKWAKIWLKWGYFMVFHHQSVYPTMRKESECHKEIVVSYMRKEMNLNRNT